MLGLEKNDFKRLRLNIFYFNRHYYKISFLLFNYINVEYNNFLNYIFFTIFLDSRVYQMLEVKSRKRSDKLSRNFRIKYTTTEPYIHA